MLRGGGVLAGVAIIGTGVAGAVFGVAVLRGGAVLFGVAVVGGGVAVAVLGVVELRGEGAAQQALRAWWARTTADRRATGTVPGPRQPEPDTIETALADADGYAPPGPDTGRKSRAHE